MNRAWDALQMLSTTAKGRANFFVLDSLRKFENPDREQFDGCTPATDVIDYDAAYQKLFELLLGHVYILNEDDSFKKFNSENLKSFVLLSKVEIF